MHALIIYNKHVSNYTIDMKNLIGWRGDKELSEIGFTRQMVSSTKRYAISET